MIRRRVRSIPTDPCDAQVILLEYLHVFESRLQHPERVPPLPYPTQTIESALRTAMRALTATGQMSDDIRSYLEMAHRALTETDSGVGEAAATANASSPVAAPVIGRC